MNYGDVIEGVLVSPLRVIDVEGGDVFHGMKLSDFGYRGFGEAYFSSIEFGVIKAWKRHREMTLNLIVPVGAIRFVIFDDRTDSVSKGHFQQVQFSRDNYCRLTVPPMVWMGFQGVSDGLNLLLNIASIEHQPDEMDRKAMNQITFSWEKTL